MNAYSRTYHTHSACGRGRHARSMQANTCECARRHARTHDVREHARAYMNVHECTRTCANTCACMRTADAHFHTRKYAHIHARTEVCTHTRMQWDVVTESRKADVIDQKLKSVSCVFYTLHCATTALCYCRIMTLPCHDAVTAIVSYNTTAPPYHDNTAVA